MVNVDQRLEEFKSCGSKIRWTHFRVYGKNPTQESHQLYTHKELKDMREQGKYDCKLVSGKGGQTHLEVTLPDGTEIKVKAKCNLKDGFNRRLGKKICYNRFMIQYEHLMETPEVGGFKLIPSMDYIRDEIRQRLLKGE